MESQNLYYNTQTTQFTPEKQKPNENFVIEDLLNFSNEEEMIGGGDTFDSYSINGNGNGNGNCSSDSSTVTVIDSCCNSSFSGSQNHQQQQQQNFPDSSQLSDELCVPYDDIAELEWLSNFVEESFSSEDMQKLQLISGIKPEISETHESQPNPIFRPAEMSVPGKARTKRSRSAPCNWSSRLLHLSHSTPEPTPTPTITSSSSESDVSMNFGGKKTTKFYKKKEVSERGDGRKCLHCGSDKTPQWRTGPLGPKTLCNACGVRFKSGRLVPEYRPAASPTFVLAKHSNSHRKVMELRRKKEMMRSDHEQFLYPNAMYGVSGGDYLVHRQTGSGFTQQLI